MTATRNNGGSVYRNLQRPEKNQSPPGLLPTAEPESQVSVLRTPTTACFCSAFKELIFNSLSFSQLLRDDRVLLIGMIRAIA